MTKVLEDITILDLTQVLAGPFALTMLGDFGANIIQIEPPGGDYGRRLQSSRPLTVQRLGNWNKRRNRKGITLNLRSPKGKDIFLKLVEKADVVVQNFTVGTMDKLGIGYDTMKRVNPNIIYCSMSGFGETGPYKNRRTYDPVIQAASGMMDMTGFPDSPPVRVGPNIADYAGGVYAIIGILLALHYKNRTGKGQMIDCSMFDALCHWTIGEIGAYSMGKKRYGNQHPWAILDLFLTKDEQYLLFTIQTDEQWEAFLKLAGKEDTISEKWTYNMRMQKNDLILQWCREWIATKTLEEAKNELDKAKIVNAEIISPQQLPFDPQVLEREMIHIIDDPKYGTIEGVVGVAPKLTETPGSIGDVTGIPDLGQHTEEILSMLLGMSQEDINNLKNEGVL